MSDIAIRVIDLCKKYIIGRSQARHDTLRDTIVYTLKNIHPGSNRQQIQDNETLWALKDVSFEVGGGRYWDHRS